MRLRINERDGAKKKRTPNEAPVFLAMGVASLIGQSFLQRLPARSTGPPRFIGVPTAPTPGVTTARATGRGRSTTPALATQPTGYSTYWQYTIALAFSVLAAMKPVISSAADNAIESFMSVSSIFYFRTSKCSPWGDLRLDADQWVSPIECRAIISCLKLQLANVRMSKL
jgi:hypothetical protein